MIVSPILATVLIDAERAAVPDKQYRPRLYDRLNPAAVCW